jgi:2-methylcitrate dehydratase PrpD
MSTEATQEVLVSLTEQLADIILRPVDATVLQRAKRHVLDWFGCALLGSTTDPGRGLARYGRTASAGPCLTLGVGRRDAPTAAFVNGGLGNILEMDDVHRLSILHPGDAVVPVALALAERTEASGAAMLDAMVRGYEASIRVGSAVGTGHYHYWYNTATCGVFGAAAAAGSLLGLDRDGLVDAFGQAGMQASGLWQCRIEPTFSKQLAAGRAAQSGLLSAELAAQGFPGAHEILEGSHGFFAATCPAPNPRAVVAGPDDDWRIGEVSFKPWAACRHVHPTIEAALGLRERVEMDQIDGIEVVTYADAVAFCDNPEPKTVIEAKFSLQHAVAVTLIQGEPTLDDFGMDTVHKPSLAEYRRRVVVTTDSAMTRAYPERLGACVAARLRDGRRVEMQIEGAKGDPENPMSEGELDAKARQLFAAAGLAEDDVETLRRVCLELPDLPSVRDLTAPAERGLEVGT